MLELRVMTWNVENLFSVAPGAEQSVIAAYQQKLQSLAKIILQFGPDILAVQEIGNLEALDDLIALLENKYPHRIVSNSPDPRGIRVGFISKLEITESENIKDLPQAGLSKIEASGERVTEISRLGRGALRIQVNPKPSLSLNLINVHFKSKLLSYPPIDNRPRFQPINENERAYTAGLALLKRTAEAVAVRVKANQLLEKDDNQALIVLGDFNDIPSAATTQIINGPSGSEIGTTAFVRKDKGDSTRLFNLAPLIPSERRYSRIFKQNKELIDSIFVSQELLGDRRNNLPQVDSKVDFDNTLPSISDDPTIRENRPSSDHAPITAIFEL